MLFAANKYELYAGKCASLNRQQLKKNFFTFINVSHYYYDDVVL
jgi:hypothetical protein